MSRKERSKQNTKNSFPLSLTLSIIKENAPFIKGKMNIIHLFIVAALKPGFSGSIHFFQKKC